MSDSRVPVVVQPNGQNVAVFLVLQCLERYGTLSAGVEIIPQELKCGVSTAHRVPTSRQPRYLEPLEDNVNLLVRERLHVALHL